MPRSPRAASARSATRPSPPLPPRPQRIRIRRPPVPDSGDDVGDRPPRVFHQDARRNPGLLDRVAVRVAHLLRGQHVHDVHCRKGAGGAPRTLFPVTLYFPESLVRESLSMRDALDAVEGVFRELGEGGAQNRPRQRVRVPGRMLHTMSASSSAFGYLGLKTYLTGRDGMRFVLLLFDQETGSLAAIMDADALGQIRTGAATGVAADYLAAPGASSVGIVGCGYQAETQLEALALVRPLTRVEAFCRNPERRARFAAKMTARLGVEVVPAPSGEAAVRGKPIVVAVTNAAEPVVRGAWLAPGAFVAAAGGNALGRCELDGAAVRHAGRIVVDDREQARIECGDLAPLVASGELAWDDLETIGEVVAAGKESAAAGPALFESQGIAAEDIAAAAVVYRRAKADATAFPAGTE